MRSQMRFLFSYLGVITFLVLLIPRYRDMKFFGIEKIIFYLKCSWNSYFLISSSQIWLLVRPGGGEPWHLNVSFFLNWLSSDLRDWKWAVVITGHSYVSLLQEFVCPWHLAWKVNMETILLLSAYYLYLPQIVFLFLWSSELIAKWKGFKNFSFCVDV